MAYTTQAEIESARIPAQLLIEALDDDRDGVADSGVIDGLISAASTEVDALLAPRYAVPFATPTPAVKAATLCFVCAAIYRKRGYADEKNPFMKCEDFWMEHLQKVGAGEANLDAAEEVSSGGAYGGAERVPGRVSMDTPE